MKKVFQHAGRPLGFFLLNRKSEKLNYLVKIIVYLLTKEGQIYCVVDAW